MNIKVFRETNFKDTELGPLPEEWRVVRLGEVVKPTKGRKPPRVVKEYQSSALPYLTAEYFRSGIVTYFVPYEDCRNLPICSPENLVLIWDGSNAGQIFTGLSGVLASTMARLDLLDSIVEHQFLYFYLLTQFESLNSQTTGSTIPHVNKNVFRSLPIPLPPFPEQRAIAYVLRTVQEAKRATERVIAALRDLKKSLMQHLFTYGPVPISDVEVQHAAPLQDTEIGPIPAHWQVVRLGEVALRIFGGGTPSTRNPDFWNGPIPWTTSAEIQNEEIELRTFRRTITEAGLRNSATNVVPKGSLLIGTRVGVGKSIVTTFDVAINQDLTAFVLNEELVTPYFLVYLLKEERYQVWFANNKKGTTIKGVPRQELVGIKILLPPLSEQQEIARILRAVDGRIQAEEAYARALDELFRTLLQELMTGKVRVRQEQEERSERGDGVP